MRLELIDRTAKILKGTSILVNLESSADTNGDNVSQVAPGVALTTLAALMTMLTDFSPVTLTTHIAHAAVPADAAAAALATRTAHMRVLAALTPSALATVEAPAPVLADARPATLATPYTTTIMLADAGAAALATLGFLSPVFAYMSSPVRCIRCTSFECSHSA